MRKIKILSFLLSATLALASPINILAATVSQNDITPATDIVLPGMGFVSLGDNYTPDTVHTDYDFEDASVYQYGRTLGDGIISANYVPVDEYFMPETFVDQKNTNMCWAISAATACEISARKKDIISLAFSASHLGYFFYNLGETVTDPQGNTAGDYIRNTSAGTWSDVGGNGRLSMWNMANWIGAVGYEPGMDSPYDFENFTASTAFDNDTETAYLQDDIHIQNVYLSGIETAAQRDDVKELIENVGAVTVGYYASTEYDSFAQGKTYNDGYETSYGNYYYDGTGSHAANHAVTLIGWDDNYSKDNFVTSPSSDGAWLVLNSWGEETADTLAQNGLFWISYEDKGLLDEGVAIAYDVESSNNYDHIYQYDGSSGIETVTGQRFVQFFDISSTQKIKALSIGVDDADASLTASVYKIDGLIDDDYISTLDTDAWLSRLLDGEECQGLDGEPVTATKLGELDKTLSYPGYHTIDVSGIDMDAVTNGTTVAVVFDFDKDTDVFIDKSAEMGIWKFVASEDPYLSVCGKAGEEKALPSGNALRIKMFTDNYADNSPAITFEESEVKVDLLSTLQLDTKISGVVDKEDYTVAYDCPENEYFTLDEDTGLITPIKIGGPVTVTAGLYDKDGTLRATAECSVTVTASLQELIIDEDSYVVGKGDTVTLTYTTVPGVAVIDKESMVWSSSDESVATVDEEGVVTGIGYGEAVITCTIGSVSDSCDIKVVTSFTGIELKEESKEIKKGSSATLTAKLLPEENKDTVDFNWESSNTDVVTVDENGKITGVNYGEAIITVSCGDYSDTCVVTVGGQLTSVELDREETAILKGKSIQLVAQAYPTDTTDDVSFTWQSSDNNVAVVDATGKVTGLDYGEATITVACGAFKDTCKVIVTGQLSAVVINKSSLLMKKGETTTLTATLEPKELAEEHEISWSSSNGNVATVDANGTVVAKGVGECNIVVKSGSFTDTCKVIVDAIKITKENTAVTSVSVKKGDKVSLSAVWSVQESVPSVKWKSNNTGIASVDETGMVTGVAKGTTSIYATTTDGKFSGAVSVIITESDIPVTPPQPDEPEEDEITISVENAASLKNLIVGQSITLRTTYSPTTLTEASLDYASSDSSIVAVSPTGVVTAKKAGTATITVKVISKEGMAQQTLTATVKEASSGSDNTDTPRETYVIAVTNEGEFRNLEVGTSKKISALVKTTEGTTVSGAVITYTADGTYVRMDSSGNIIGVKAGTGIVTITAKVSNTTLSKALYVSVIPNTGGSSTSSNNKKEEVTPPSSSESGSQIVIAPEEPKVEKIYVTKISLKGATRRISNKGKLQLTATVKPSNAENKKVKWYSSNKRYATVTQDGLVKAKKAGAGRNVIITCKAVDGSGTVASYSIYITKDSVKKVSLSTTQTTTKKVKNADGKKVTKKVTKTLTKSITVKAGKTVKLKAKVTTTGKDASKKLVWTTSNKKWATVSSSGKVKTKKAGKGHTVTITAKTLDGSKKATFKVKIK